MGEKNLHKQEDTSTVGDSGALIWLFIPTEAKHSKQDADGHQDNYHQTYAAENDTNCVPVGGGGWRGEVVCVCVCECVMVRVIEEGGQ